MSNLPEPPQKLTERLTVKKAFQAIGAGIFILAGLIDSFCITVVFIHLSATIPALKLYAGYVASYTLGARTVFLVVVFLVGCYWCILRLVAPERAGSSILEWNSKVQANTSNEKLGRARRIWSVVGALNTCNGLFSVFRWWKAPDFDVYQFVTGLALLSLGAGSIYVAYVGRLSPKKINNVSQPELDEVTPGEDKDDSTTTQ
ncbi:hypothetical protein DFH29DRAFT_923215 [Suillus ampliporus]|nr:hypothetical protein DFH29DRAFT_923215 [Suillus ampliporus]